jgi:hypothetical protein
MSKSRETRLIEVAEYLADRVGQWVPGTEFANENVGGSEGRKRMRELRLEHEWDIEKRRMTGRTQYEYRFNG